MIDYVVKLQPMRGEGQDRAAVFARDDGSITIVLADGAGGTSHGAEAAQAVIDSVDSLAGSDADWSVVLQTLDAGLRGGQTTAIVLTVGDSIRGASVGDSEAWLVDARQRIKALTADQSRKPLLGSQAHVTPTIEERLGDATLVVASDGLFRMAKAIDITRIVVGDDLQRAAEQLVELVRTASGKLLDDVSIVLVRRQAV
jgi:serine/threonine protein phosphatase PrpC